MSSRLEEVFTRVVGPDAMSMVRASLRLRPLILLGGDQLTGKSCTAQLLAARFGGEAGSTGSLLRQQAALEGRSIEAKGRLLAAHPNADVWLDFEAYAALAKGAWSVYECRMAGELGRMLRQAGHPWVVTVYLTCRPRERALRQVERSLGPGGRERVEGLLPSDDERPFAAWLEEVVGNLGPVDGATINLAEVANRDRLDRDRLLLLYAVDYADTGGYDLVVPTDERTPGEVAGEILRDWRMSHERP